MSYLPNAPWTPSEKVDLLVNVLRSSVPEPSLFLMQVFNEKGIYPKWNDTPLPAGRSLASSQIIYEEMGRPFKQQGQYNVQPAGAHHIPPIAPAIPTRRPFPEFDSFAPHQQQQQQQQLQQQRTLQPRPPRSTDSPIPVVTNGETPTVIRPPVTLSDHPHEPHRKKRGRPSKEEAEERDRALAAEGKVYQPKKRPAKKARPSLEPPTSARTSEVPTLSIQTPPTRTPEPREEDSSGKRKMKRSPRDEEAHTIKPIEGRTGSPPPGPTSPSDRLLAPHRERDLDILLTRETPKFSPQITTKAEDKE